MSGNNGRKGTENAHDENWSLEFDTKLSAQTWRFGESALYHSLVHIILLSFPMFVRNGILES